MKNFGESFFIGDRAQAAAKEAASTATDASLATADPNVVAAQQAAKEFIAAHPGVPIVDVDTEPEHKPFQMGDEFGHIEGEDVARRVQG